MKYEPTQTFPPQSKLSLPFGGLDYGERLVSQAKAHGDFGRKMGIFSTGGLCLHAAAGLFAMGLATPAPSLQAAHKEDKMLAWLQFDEGTGTTVADASGNNNSGAFVNSPAWVDGFKGKALEFNNTDKGVEIASL